MVSLCLYTFHVDFELSFIIESDVHFIINFGDAISFIFAEESIFCGHQAVIGFAAIEVIREPGSVDAITSYHTFGIVINCDIGTGDK